MTAYLSRELSPGMQHAVEKYLLDHPFEAEAMEGFAENTSALNDLHVLDDRIASRIRESEEEAPVPLWRQFLPYAASFTLLLVATVAAVYFYGRVGSEDGISLKATDFIQLDSFSSRATPQPIVDSAIVAKIEIQEEVSQTQNTAFKETSEPTKGKIAAYKVVEDLDLVAADVPTASVVEKEESPTAASEQIAMAALEDTVEEELLKVEDAVAVDTESRAKKAIRSNIASQGLDTGTPAKEASEKFTIDSKNQMIAGQVTDAATGEVLPGVSVYIKNTNTGVNTDLDGNFSIKATIGDVLIVSFIGTDNKAVEITNSDFLKIELSTDIPQLSEVVVTDYRKSEDKAESYQSAQPEIGMKAYKQYLKEQLQYPASAMENKTEGKVKLILSISASGSIVNIEVVKSVSEACDSEAIRLVRSGPGWQGAEKNGEAVESTLKLKVVFELPEK
jgi:TonB family protein